MAGSSVATIRSTLRQVWLGDDAEQVHERACLGVCQPVDHCLAVAAAGDERRATPAYSSSSAAFAPSDIMFADGQMFKK